MSAPQAENKPDAATENGVNLNDGEELELDYEALDKELSDLNSCLDTMENWSNSLQQKVADLLESTRQQNKEGKTMEKMEIDEKKSKDC